MYITIYRKWRIQMSKMNLKEYLEYDAVNESNLNVFNKIFDKAVLTKTPKKRIMLMALMNLKIAMDSTSDKNMINFTDNILRQYLSRI